MMKAYILSIALAIACSNPAQAQGGFGGKRDLQDASQFYMSRRQVQVIDDSPIIKTGNGQLAPAGANGINGGAPLQRAGFSSYTSSMPTITAPLPKVNNGVPKPDPIGGGSAGGSNTYKNAKAKAGALSNSKGKPKAAAKTPAAPSGVQSYGEYRGYSTQGAGEYALSNGGAAASSSTSTNVRGSVLHWSRKRKSGQ